jgi:5'-nucleotidase
MGDDLLYSGTVGAALEGRGLSYPSIAISAAAFHQPGSKNFLEPNYETAAKVVLDLIENYDLGVIDPSIVLNINTPNLDFSLGLNYLITSIGTWGARVPPIVENKNNQITYWTSHREDFPSNKEHTDIVCLESNNISISPIYPQFTDEKVLNQEFYLKKK